MFCALFLILEFRARQKPERTGTPCSFSFCRFGVSLEMCKEISCRVQNPLDFVAMSSTTQNLWLYQLQLSLSSPRNLNATRLKIPINLNPISSDESSAAEKLCSTAADDESYHVGQQTASRTFSSSIFKSHSSTKISPNTNAAYRNTNAALYDVNVLLLACHEERKICSVS